MLSQEVETDDSVGVDVGMDRNRPVVRLQKGDFGGFDRVGGRELELETIRLALVKRVFVKNFDVEKPFFKILCRDELDTRRKTVVDLTELLCQPLGRETGCHFRW